MYRGGRADGAERIVRHQIDVVRFAPASHLHRLGEPANIANVDPIKLMDAALDIGQELPLAGKLFTDGKWNVRHSTQYFVSLGRFVAYRLFQEIEHASAELAAEACGLSNREAVMVIDAE